MRQTAPSGVLAAIQAGRRGGRRLAGFGHLPRLLSVAALVVATQPLLAATITVNSFDSEVNPNDGDCTLREAITAANHDEASGPWLGECAAGSGADTIVLTGDVLLDVVDNNAHFKESNGLPAIDTEITLEGNDHSITRNAIAPGFRFFFLWQSASLTLKSTTLSGGQSEGEGGAIYNFYGMLTLAATTLSGNSAQYGGGAIFNFGKVTLADSTLSGNTAGSGRSGGGLLNFASGSALLIDSTVSGNTGGHSGGGIHQQSHGTLTLIRATVSLNTANFGGGISLAYGPVAVLMSTLSNNSALDSGGGMHVWSLGSAKLVDSTVSTNSALHGGGINILGGELTVIRSTLDHNAAFSGGGIEILSGSAALTNSTLSHNLAVDGSGGGINNLGGSVDLTHATIMDSTATTGGAGIHSEAGTVDVTNTVVADSAGPDCSGAITSHGVNFNDDDSCPWPGRISLIDPNLSDNGGPTMTHALFSGSTTIGTVFACHELTDQNTDQRGGFRYYSDLWCDSGAFEYNSDDRYENSGSGGDDDSCPGHQIQYGQAEHHLLRDEDWVWFDVQVGATYEIETSELHGLPPADTYLDLWRSCTTHRAGNDNGGVGNASKITYTATLEDVEAGGLDVRVQEVVAYDNDIGYDLTVTCIANCPPCTASGFNVFSLFDETVLAFRLIEACQTISAERTVVGLGGMLMLRAGASVAFSEGFQVSAGGELVVETDPSLKE